METEFDALLPTVATKKDIVDLRREMAQVDDKLRAEIANLRGQMMSAEFRREMAANTAETIVEIHKIVNSQIRWIVGLAIGLFIAFVGVTHYT